MVSLSSFNLFKPSSNFFSSTICCKRDWASSFQNFSSSRSWIRPCAHLCERCSSDQGPMLRATHIESTKPSGGHSSGGAQSQLQGPATSNSSRWAGGSRTWGSRIRKNWRQKLFSGVVGVIGPSSVEDALVQDGVARTDPEQNAARERPRMPPSSFGANTCVQEIAVHGSRLCAFRQPLWLPKGWALARELPPRIPQSSPCLWKARPYQKRGYNGHGSPFTFAAPDSQRNSTNRNKGTYRNETKKQNQKNWACIEFLREAHIAYELGAALW